MHTNSEQLRVKLIVYYKDNYEPENGLDKRFSLIESIQCLVLTLSPIHSVSFGG
jgi:hypothetical protein